MFYYRVSTTTTTDKAGTSTTHRKTEYLEFLRPRDLGEYVADLMLKRRPRAMTIQPINQKTYVKHTRSD